MMLDRIIQKTEQYLSSKGKAERKRIGQFFTSRETAVYMADMFSIPQSSLVTILDPGAGTGILSVALIERLQKCDHIKEIQLTCYENDHKVMELLRENLEYVKNASRSKVLYSIVTDNYITSQGDDFNHTMLSTGSAQKFDFVIGNPAGNYGLTA